MIDTHDDTSQAEPHEPFEFSSRLLLTYVLAALAYAAAEQSIYIFSVAFIAWSFFTARLFLRFRALAFWSLLGAPLAFYWLFLMTAPMRSDTLIV